MDTTSSVSKGKKNGKASMDINCIFGVSVEIDGVKLLETAKDYVKSAFDWIFK